MAAAKSLLGIFVVVSYCFTTGSGLLCHVCKGVYGSHDACDEGKDSETEVCYPDQVWPWKSLQRLTTNRIMVNDLPPEEKTKDAKNLACMKIIRGAEGIDKQVIIRSCSFKKFGKTDGCGMEHEMAANMILAPDANGGNAITMTQEIEAKEKLKEQCDLCYGDICNAGLTPAFFIHLPLLVLVLIILKLFFQ